jgi:hypothetical protein
MTQFSSLYGTRLDRELGSADSTQLFTTARRKSAINEGVQQFADLTECYKSFDVLTWPSQQTELNLSTLVGTGDFVRLDAEGVTLTYTDSAGTARAIGGDDLPRVDRAWLTRYRPGWQTSTVSTATVQLPTAYYVAQDAGELVVGLSPTPSAGSTAASMTLTIAYVARPATLTQDTDEPFKDGGNVRADLRIYHQAAVHYAAAQLEKYRRDTQASAEQMQAFMGYVQRFVGASKRKGGQAIALATNYFRRGR